MVNSAEPLQRDGSTVNAAWTIISNLIAGIVLYGGIGWLLSLWLGHRAVFVAGGVLIGTALTARKAVMTAMAERTVVRRRRAT